MHIHANVLQFFIDLAQLLIMLFGIRAISYTWPDSRVGKALSVL